MTPDNLIESNLRKYEFFPHTLSKGDARGDGKHVIFSFALNVNQRTTLPSVISGESITE